MFVQTIKRVVGSKNERDLKKIRPFVNRIGELEPEMQALTYN